MITIESWLLRYGMKNADTIIVFSGNYYPDNPKSLLYGLYPSGPRPTEFDRGCMDDTYSRRKSGSRPSRTAARASMWSGEAIAVACLRRYSSKNWPCV